MYNYLFNKYYTVTVDEVKDIMRSARTSKGLNQKEFSVVMAKSQTMISRYESGESIPPGNILKTCQDMLNTVPASILETQDAFAETEELVRLIREQVSEPKQAKARQAIRLILEIASEIGNKNGKRQIKRKNQKG